MQKLIFFLYIFSMIICTQKHEMSSEIIMASKYEGKWEKVIGQQIDVASVLSNFNTKQGDVIVHFSDLGKDLSKIQGVILQFLHPKYYDQKIIKIIIEFVDTKSQQRNWSGRANSDYEVYENTKTIEKGKIDIAYKVEEQNSALSFQINNIEISIWLSYEKVTISPITAFIFAFYALLVFFGTQRPGNILNTYFRHHIIPIILSTSFIFMVSIVELIIGFNSLFGVMNPETFFILAGFINLSTCIQTLRFYGSIILRKNILIIMVWIVTFGYICFLLLFRHSYIFFIINSFILLPEIIYHCIRGKKIKSDRKMILFSICPQFYVLYFKSCPENIFRESPNYLLGYCLLGLITIQIAFIRAQIRFGPRFFIPSIFLPKKHKYYNKKKIAQLLRQKKFDDECGICLTEVKILEFEKRRLMVTPCNHIFHADCLEEWMTVRMNCPTDRSVLPKY